MTSKTCVVIGAGPGLGLSVAKKFGAKGYRVALLARRREALDLRVATLKEAGIEARGFVADVEDRPGLVAALNDVRREFGPVEVLYYGAEPHTPPQDLSRWMPVTLTVEETQWRMNLTVYGLMTAAQTLLPDMLEQGSGTILSVMGGSGADPIPTLTPCAMSFGAARNYLLSLNQQLAGKNIYVAPVFLTLLIEPGDEYGDPDKLAEMLWNLHVDRDVPEVNVLTPIDIHAVNANDMKKYGIALPEK